MILNQRPLITIGNQLNIFTGKSADNSINLNSGVTKLESYCVKRWQYARNCSNKPSHLFHFEAGRRRRAGAGDLPEGGDRRLHKFVGYALSSLIFPGS